MGSFFYLLVLTYCDVVRSRKRSVHVGAGFKEGYSVAGSSDKQLATRQPALPPPTTVRSIASSVAFKSSTPEIRRRKIVKRDHGGGRLVLY
jgi:hypothetical protein